MPLRRLHPVIIRAQSEITALPVGTKTARILAVAGILRGPGPDMRAPVNMVGLRGFEPPTFIHRPFVIATWVLSCPGINSSYAGSRMLAIGKIRRHALSWYTSQMSAPRSSTASFNNGVIGASHRA